MRKTITLNQGWHFTGPNGTELPVDVPHTWNNIDGQDGGNDYWRGTCAYRKTFPKPEFGADEQVYLQFQGVNASAKVELNGQTVGSHDGGYSTFRWDVTDLLQDENQLTVHVDNSVNDRVYPQKADFTFYGGIYRDVDLIIVNRCHFDMDYFGGPGIKVTAEPVDDYRRGKVVVDTWRSCEEGQVCISILDADGKTVASADEASAKLDISDVHLWDGVKSPYLYTATATLTVDGKEVDRVSTRFGVRDFHVDPDKGFFLNGRSYPLHGVSRHQDWKGIGNAITREHHDTDMALIREMGVNTIRLAHYQHDQYFYDLCDQYGMVVWAEIPYISEHMPNGRDNTISQATELVVQNYNHPSIVVWGVSNEITISTKDKADMLDNHKVLNDLYHQLDPTRLTTLACYAMCGPFNKSAHITDVVSWNLYLGWYVPGLFLNDLWIDFFHWKYPKRPLGYSEYGCEAMTNLHSSKPKREDQTEEYQCVYHEYLLKCFDKRPFMWATHVWNMFDFAADARDQGGEPFVHICSKRYVDRNETTTHVKVYSNQKTVTLYANGEKVAEQTGSKIFNFTVPLSGEVKLEAAAGELRDQSVVRYVDKPNPDYILKKGEGKGKNWI